MGKQILDITSWEGQFFWTFLFGAIALISSMKDKEVDRMLVVASIIFIIVFTSCVYVFGFITAIEGLGSPNM